MILRIDKREKIAEIQDILFEMCNEAGVTLEEENQDIGDYVWYNDDGSHTGIVVEYKDLPSEDFFKSTQTGHLDTQLLDMCQYPYPILIIGGAFDPKHYRGKFTRKQVLAKMASVSIRTGAKVVWFERYHDVCNYIMQLPVQLEKGAKVDIIAHRHHKTRNRQNHNLNQFLALPTIGAKRAEALCEEHKTFYNFLMAASQGPIEDLPRGAREYVAEITGVDADLLVPEIEKWTSIPGIGAASAKKYMEQGLTIDQFISRVDGGIIKVGIQTKRWVEDQVRKHRKT